MRVAVIGGGVVGLSVTAALLRKPDCEVRCFEPNEPMKARSVGETRIFRTSHRDPRLVELAMSVRSDWDRWGRVFGRELINRRGLIYSGHEVRQRLQAMKDGGAPCELVDGSVYLRDVTTHNFSAPSLLDPQAGVIDANATRLLLVTTTEKAMSPQRVVRLEPTGNTTAVVTETDSWNADAVVVTAGQHTASLVGEVGIEIEPRLMHVARFAFRTRNRFAMPLCWVDQVDDIQMWGLPVQSGVFALGVSWPHAPVSMATSAEDSMLAQLQTAHRFLSLRADRLTPGPIQTLSCVADNTGDAMFARRSGNVLAFWGDNLFKFAPLLGQRLADATVDMKLPDLPLTNAD